MKKVLILGNSHVGALKHGVDQLADQDIDYQFSFAALPAPLFPRFRLKNRKLSVPFEHQAIFQSIYADGPFVDLDMYNNVVFVNGPSRLSGNLYLVNRKLPFYSTSLIREIAIHGLMPPLFDSLRKTVEPARLIYLGAPLLSERATLPRHLASIPLIETDADYAAINRLVATIRNCCSETVDDPSVPTFLLPPAELLNSIGMNTLDIFIRGGMRMDGNSRTSSSNDYRRDMSHGNASYGSRVVLALLQALQHTQV